MSRSEAGALLAAEMAAHLDLMVDGRAVPILKETRAPAVVIATAALGASVGEKAVTAMASFLVRAALRRGGRRSAEQPPVETLQFGDRAVVDHHPPRSLRYWISTFAPSCSASRCSNSKSAGGRSSGSPRERWPPPLLALTASSIRRTDQPSSTASRHVFGEPLVIQPDQRPGMTSAQLASLEHPLDHRREG